MSATESAPIETEDLDDDALGAVEAAAIRNIKACKASDADPDSHEKGIELAESIDELDATVPSDVILALVRELKRRRLEAKPPQP